MDQEAFLSQLLSGFRLGWLTTGTARVEARERLLILAEDCLLLVLALMATRTHQPGAEAERKAVRKDVGQVMILGEWCGGV